MITRRKIRNPLKIAVASGKGGTGKTTVAVNLFHFFSRTFGFKTQLVDCDVEEPNDLLFFPESNLEDKETATQLIPQIDNNRCTFCRNCVSFCEFNAIVVIPPVNFSEVNSSLCHSCGACSVACEFEAISEIPETIGTIRDYRIGPNEILSEGRLKIGSAMQTLLISKVKQKVREDMEVVILDAPPGTSCPVVETISEADYVILVTEPTPFGLYDLRLTVDLLREIRKPFGAIINKSGIGNHKVHKFLSDQKIELLSEIPYNRDYASKYASGELLSSHGMEIELKYKAIRENV